MGNRITPANVPAQGSTLALTPQPCCYGLDTQGTRTGDSATNLKAASTHRAAATTRTTTSEREGLNSSLSPESRRRSQSGLSHESPTPLPDRLTASAHTRAWVTSSKSVLTPPRESLRARRRHPVGQVLLSHTALHSSQIFTTKGSNFRPLFRQAVTSSFLVLER